MFLNGFFFGFQLHVMCVHAWYGMQARPHLARPTHGYCGDWQDEETPASRTQHRDDVQTAQGCGANAGTVTVRDASLSGLLNSIRLPGWMEHLHNII